MSATAVKAGVAKDGGEILATFTGGDAEPLTVDATTPAIVDPKSLFIGKHVSFHFVMDENQAARDTACNDPKSKAPRSCASPPALADHRVAAVKGNDEMSGSGRGVTPRPLWQVYSSGRETFR
jgi:hypothetical protein